MTDKDTKQPVAEKKGILLPVCVVCEQTPPLGIAGGIVISGCFLCTDCEKEIVAAQAGDLHYLRLKEKLKKIWEYGRI
jgi:hypothetical protein